MDFLLTAQDIWCILISKHKMLFYLTLYKGLILASPLLEIDVDAYLTLYKGLIHDGKNFFESIFFPTLPYIRD